MVIGIDASRANKIQKTGVEWYSYHVIEELKRVIPLEVTVRLYSDQALTHDLAYLPPNWESLVLRWPPRYLWTVLRLSFEMLVRKPDLLFVPGSALPFMLPKRTITTIPDIGYVRLPSAYRARSRWYLHLNVRRAVKRCWRIITVSEYSKRELINVYGIESRRVAVTLLAPHLSTKSDEGKLSNSNCLISGPYFIYLGRYEKKKNVDGIVQAFARFREVNPDYKLVLVGSRGYGAELIDQILKKIGSERIVVLPWVKDAERMALLTGARALLFPTRYEGFGMPILEAFSVGVPVVATSGGAAEEIAGSAALFVSPENEDELVEAMREVAANDEQCSLLTKKGYERVREFTWQRTAKETWQVLLDSLYGTL
ncbi:MAG: glycosyltransferase family 1 protein [Patescibacteria group bacterium]|jgi:glycosyltransferase involved in cell wall biosynthesis